MTIFNNFIEMSAEKRPRLDGELYSVSKYTLAPPPGVSKEAFKNMIEFCESGVPGTKPYYYRWAHWLYRVLAERGSKKADFEAFMQRLQYILDGVLGIYGDALYPRNVISPYMLDDIPSIRRQVNDFMKREGWGSLLEFLHAYSDDFADPDFLNNGNFTMRFSFLYPFVLLALQGNYNFDMIPPSSLRAKFVLYEPLIIENADKLYMRSLNFGDVTGKYKLHVPTWAYPWHRKGPVPEARLEAEEAFVKDTKQISDYRDFDLWQNYEELLEENKKKAVKMYVTDDPDAVTYIMGGTHATGFWIQVFYNDGSNQTYDFMPAMPPKPAGL